MKYKGYYHFLGVGTATTPEEIKKAFGNLFVKIDIRLPDHLREEEIELFRQLAALRGKEKFDRAGDNDHASHHGPYAHSTQENVK